GPAGGGRQPQASSEAAGTPCRACREPPAACRPPPAGTRSPAGLAPGRPKKRNRLLLLCRLARSRTRTAGWVKSRCGRAELPLPAGRAAGRTEPPPLPGPIQTRGAETGSPSFSFKGGGARPAVWPPPTPSPLARSRQTNRPGGKAKAGECEPSETLKEIDDVYEKYKKEDDLNQKKRLQQLLQRALINSQELGDEKIQIVTQMLELVENRARQMELHSQCFQDPAESERASDKAKMDSSQPERSSRRPRRQRTSESRDLCHMANGIEDCDDQPPKEKKSKSAKKKKRSKAKQEREASPVEFAIDPNEPTYCLCNQVSYGEMIGCDNEQCPIEWFHFSCVSLTYKPKGKWYCPKCRGDNEKTMDKSTEKTKKDRRSR
uniref:Inhibitor of growth protein n=2 Tax=Cercopithecinae TaxID=9528 RepID=A0A8D2G0R1_THEGE